MQAVQQASLGKGSETMKITGVDILVAGAGWRNFNFVKVTTDEGLVGWADFS